MWEHCRPWGVAAITYDPIAKTDLTRLPRDEAYGSWDQLAPAQKASLSRVAYEMRGGDVIYVKEGPTIISRGRIKGTRGSRAYMFDQAERIIDFHGVPWNHQVPVEWATDFSPVHVQVGGSQRPVVAKLTRADVSKIESAMRSTESAEAVSRKAALIEDKYYRDSSARRDLIIPRHNKLSNAFCHWLRNEHHVYAIQERDQVDIRFQ